jgi:hypothetical protein
MNDNESTSFIMNEKINILESTSSMNHNLDDLDLKFHLVKVKISEEKLNHNLIYFKLITKSKYHTI